LIDAGRDDVSSSKVVVSYYSDLLCIWAYVAQIRVDELVRNFGDDVKIALRFVPIFGNTAERIGHRWQDRGGFAGYSKHVREVAARFDHVDLHPEIWTRNAPASSFGVHLFLRAAALATDNGGKIVEQLSWRLRLAFFRDLRDIARLDTQQDIARELRLPLDAIRERTEDGSAFAALAADHESAMQHGIGGSPTFLFNDGRQKLYGNVGYRIIEANIEELLRDNTNRASWC
jgi:predicted DsbA family dithiol-disulfide isomerase